MRIHLARFAAVVAVAAFAAAGASDATAQCISGREFATVGGMGTEKLRIDPVWSHAAGQEIGRFWSPDDSTRLNNFGDGCPSNDPSQTFGEWWTESPVGSGMRGIRGVMSGTGCVASTCHDEDLLVVVEDWGPRRPTGSPGLGVVRRAAGSTRPSGRRGEPSMGLRAR